MLATIKVWLACMFSLMLIWKKKVIDWSKNYLICVRRIMTLISGSVLQRLPLMMQGLPVDLDKNRRGTEFLSTSTEWWFQDHIDVIWYCSKFCCFLFCAFCCLVFDLCFLSSRSALSSTSTSSHNFCWTSFHDDSAFWKTTLLLWWFYYVFPRWPLNSQICCWCVARNRFALLFLFSCHLFLGYHISRFHWFTGQI